MRRRHFITLFGGAAAALPLAALAESSLKLALVGWLSGAPLASTTSTRIFLQGLQDLGYVEGRDFQITYRARMAVTPNFVSYVLSLFIWQSTGTITTTFCTPLRA
jgi:hypothetical protein